MNLRARAARLAGMEPSPTTQRDLSTPSRTFSSGEGRAGLAVTIGGLLSLLLDKAQTLNMDGTEQKIVVAGVFFVSGCLIVARGLSKLGTGL